MTGRLKEAWSEFLAYGRHEQHKIGCKTLREFRCPWLIYQNLKLAMEAEINAGCEIEAGAPGRPD